MKKHSWIISFLIYLGTAYAMSFIAKDENGDNDYVMGLVAALGVYFGPWAAKKFHTKKETKPKT
jgi:hypothetical protein